VIRTTFQANPSRSSSVIASPEGSTSHHRSPWKADRRKALDQTGADRCRRVSAHNSCVRTALGAICVCLVLGACGGGSSSSQWKDLQTVRVTVAQPGLPPPYGEPKTTSFTTQGQLTRVTTALNAHHITQASSTSTSNGCSGGFTIKIAIVPKSGTPTNLSAYRCAKQTTGDVSGDVTGFLSSIGVRLQ
jgi:hypothetical protein